MLTISSIFKNKEFCVRMLFEALNHFFDSIYSLKTSTLNQWVSSQITEINLYPNKQFKEWKKKSNNSIILILVP